MSTYFRKYAYILFFQNGLTKMVVPTTQQIENGVVMEETALDSGTMRARLSGGQWLEFSFASIKNIVPMGV